VGAVAAAEHRPAVPHGDRTLAGLFARSHCAARELAGRPADSLSRAYPIARPAAAAQRLSCCVVCIVRDGDGTQLGGDADVPLPGGQDDGDASGAPMVRARASFQAILSAFPCHETLLPAQGSKQTVPRLAMHAPSGTPSSTPPTPTWASFHCLPAGLLMIIQSKPNLNKDQNAKNQLATV